MPRAVHADDVANKVMDAMHGAGIKATDKQTEQVWNAVFEFVQRKNENYEARHPRL